jgi:hypothetical protein
MVQKVLVALVTVAFIERFAVRQPLLRRRERGALPPHVLAGHRALPAPRNAYILLRNSIYFHGNGITQAPVVLLVYALVGALVLGLLDWFRSPLPELVTPETEDEAVTMVIPIGAVTSTAPHDQDGRGRRSLRAHPVIAGTHNGRRGARQHELGIAPAAAQLPRHDSAVPGRASPWTWPTPLTSPARAAGFCSPSPASASPSSARSWPGLLQKRTAKTAQQSPAHQDQAGLAARGASPLSAGDGGLRGFPQAHLAAK